MSPQQRAVRDQVVGGVITLIVSILLLVCTGAWSSKENVADHRADMQAMRAWNQRLLDVVCLDHPGARQCTPSSETP